MNTYSTTVKLLVCLALIFSSTAATFAQQTYFVKADAAGNADGSTWADAFPHLNQAIASAQAGDQIWVAAGTFTPDPGGSDRSKRFALPSGVKLFGSFAGSEASPAQRDFSGGPTTTLSGNVGNPADSTDNSFTILYLDYPDTSTVVDGFELRHGFAKSDTSSNLAGPTLCGAAAFVMSNYGYGYATFKHCTFRDNYAKGSGGAVYIAGKNTLGNTPVFEDCRFENNVVSRHGGAIYWEGGNDWDRGTEFLRDTFVSNRVDNSVSNQVAACARMRKNFGKDIIDLDQCLASKNVGKTLGVSFVVESNDNYFIGFRVGNSFFSNNHSIVLITSASDIYLFSTTNSPSIPLSWLLSVNDCEFDKNDYNFLVNEEISSLYDVLDSSSISEIRNNLIRNCNKASIVLPSISPIGYNFSDNYFADCSSVEEFESQNSICENVERVYLYSKLSPHRNNRFVNCSLTFETYSPNPKFIGLDNCAFVRCEQYSYAGGLWLPDAKIENCIFHLNRNGEPWKNLPFPKLPKTVNTFNNNQVDFPLDTLLKYAPNAQGNLHEVDPMFIDTAQGDYRLSPCSPLINAGTNEPWAGQANPIDLAGTPRIQDGTVDIGPYESPALQKDMATTAQTACGPNAVSSAHFHLQNGCPPYIFHWQYGTTAGTDTTNLAAGLYFFTVTDQKGKVFLDTLTINGSNPALTLTGDEVLCPGDSSGMLVATVSGAVEPVNYQWNNGAASPSLSNLTKGTYALTIVDASGCGATDSVNIEIAPKTTINDTILNATGPTSPDGSILLTLISGLPPFDFDWSNGDTTGNNAHLLPGDYVLSVTNGAGCQDTFHFTVGFTIKTNEAGQPQPAYLLPNPASDRAELYWGDFERFRLFNHLGQLEFYHESHQSSYDIDLTGLLPGIYHYVFEKKDGRRMDGKLVIAR